MAAQSANTDGRTRVRECQRETRPAAVPRGKSLSDLSAPRDCAAIRVGFRDPVLFVALLAQPVIDGWMRTFAGAMAVRRGLTLTMLFCHSATPCDVLEHVKRRARDVLENANGP
jgi:hypothetical protein